MSALPVKVYATPPYSTKRRTPGIRERRSRFSSIRPICYSRKPNPIRINAIADTSGGLFRASDSLIARALAHKEAGLSLREFSSAVISNAGEFIRALPSAGISLLVEALPTNITDGQPALGLIAGAIEQGINVVTVDKGPLVHV
jgi:homoserine dehydrogenase